VCGRARRWTNLYTVLVSLYEHGENCLTTTTLPLLPPLYPLFPEREREREEARERVLDLDLPLGSRVG
jgi:hypothetical protein